jgi:DNA polymerase-3 subunit gamma/tau
MLDQLPRRPRERDVRPSSSCLAVEEDALFRICDLSSTATPPASSPLSRPEEGHDLGRLVTDLIEHLRHLMLVQHMGQVPEGVPVTEESRERLRDQANQLGEPTVVRLIDLLAVAVEDMRQGGDPRLPLELALVKVTRPAADLGRESVSFRLERLEEAARGRRAAASDPSRRARRHPRPSRNRPPKPGRSTSSSSSCRRPGRGRIPAI